MSEHLPFEHEFDELLELMVTYILEKTLQCQFWKFMLCLLNNKIYYKVIFY